MNHLDRNRIKNYMYRYSIKDAAENFNKLAEVIKKKEILHLSYNFICNWQLPYNRRRFNRNNC